MSTDLSGFTHRKTVVGGDQLRHRVAGRQRGAMHLADRGGRRDGDRHGVRDGAHERVAQTRDAQGGGTIAQQERDQRVGTREDQEIRLRQGPAIEGRLDDPARDHRSDPGEREEADEQDRDEDGRPVVLGQPLGRGVDARLERCERFAVAHLDRARFEPVVLFYQSNPYVERLRGLGVAVHVWEAERARDTTPTTWEISCGSVVVM